MFDVGVKLYLTYLTYIEVLTSFRGHFSYSEHLDFLQFKHYTHYSAHSPSGDFSGRLHQVLCTLISPSTKLKLVIFTTIMILLSYNCVYPNQVPPCQLPLWEERLEKTNNFRQRSDLLFSHQNVAIFVLMKGACCNDCAMHPSFMRKLNM